MFDPHDKKLDSVLRRVKRHLRIRPEPHALEGPTTSVFLCMTPRSGSSYLASLLKANGFGKFNEIFRVTGGLMEKIVQAHNLTDYDDYVRERIGSAILNGVFGTKVDWLQFAHLYHFGRIGVFFPKAKYIYLKRNDVVAQATSRYVASRTGYYHTVGRDDEGRRDLDVPFDFEAMRAHLDHIVEMEAAWTRFFAIEDVSPLRLTYEELEADPGAVLGAVSTYLNLPLPRPIRLDSAYRRIRDERHAALKAQFIEEARRRQSIRVRDAIENGSAGPIPGG